MSNVLLQMPASESPQRKIANRIANNPGKSPNSKSKHNQKDKMFPKYFAIVVLFLKQVESIIFVNSKFIVDEYSRKAL